MLSEAAQTSLYRIMLRASNHGRSIYALGTLLDKTGVASWAEIGKATGTLHLDRRFAETRSLCEAIKLSRHRDRMHQAKVNRHATRKSRFGVSA